VLAKKLQHRAERLAAEHFLGGPVETFEAIGRMQLITLLRCGLNPDSRVLDLGCGCLRGGYWMIHFLQPGRYFGIEPNVDMLEMGKNEIVGPTVIANKQPAFLTNDRFDPSGFAERFDYFVARSIWTHASRGQIRQMLDAFARFGADDSCFLTSYLPVEDGGPGYLGDEWVGRSHESGSRGVVQHDFGWIEAECLGRRFEVSPLEGGRHRQTWLVITKGDGWGGSGQCLEDRLHDSTERARPARRFRRSIERIIRRWMGSA
jgi:SAM-dependent methyltransferase